MKILNKLHAGAKTILPLRQVIKEYFLVKSNSLNIINSAACSITFLVFFLFATIAGNAQGIEGKYKLIKESNGKSPKSEAEIIMTFASSTFKIKATQPGQMVEDIGTYKKTGNNITITFKEMEQGRQTGAFTLDNGTLTLPFKMLSDGKGSSIWQKVGTQAISTTVSTGSIPDIIKQNMENAKKKSKWCDKLDSRAAATSKQVKGGLAEAYYIQASLFYFKAYYAEAVYGFAKAAQLQPTNGLYLNNLAMVLMDMNKYSDAVVILKEVTHSFPNLASPWGNLAIAYLKTYNLAGADSAIRIAVRLAPDDGLYCYTDGKIQEERGREKEAQDNFEKAWDLGYAGSGREGGKSSNASVRKNNPPAKPNQTVPKPPKKNPQNEEKDKLAQWEGHYEAMSARARSGETAKEANTNFGSGMASTTLNLQTLACAKEFSMDISKMGNINGNGKVMYVYQGGASGPIVGLAPASIAAANGGFTTNLKDGFQIRDWSFTGTVDEDGNVEINGMPQGELDLLNVGKWQKIKPWSPLPPDAPGAAMKGPFHMRMVMDEKLGPYIQVDQYLDLNDKLIKKIHYQAYIVKTDKEITPDCKYVGPDAEPKCPASEFIKTKVAFTPLEHINIEASNTYTKGKDGVQSQQEMAVNVAGDWSFGPPLSPVSGVASMEFHQDNSMEFTVGIGVDTEKFLHGSPASLSEKLELIYDTKCGFGVKASAGAKMSSKSASVEGVIFFNKGL